MRRRGPLVLLVLGSCNDNTHALSSKETMSLLAEGGGEGCSRDERHLDRAIDCRPHRHTSESPFGLSSPLE